MPKTRRQYAGGGVASTLTGAIAASGVTTFSIASSTNWSTSTTIPFFVVLSPQTSSEEKMLVTLSSNTLTIVSRGVDGTSAASHDSGATIYPVFTALDADEANELTSMYAIQGDLVYQGASTFARLGLPGTAGHVLKANSGLTAPEWGQIGTNGIADTAVTLAKLATAVQNLLVPVGTISAYAGASAPTGWLLCNGTSTSGYAALAALVGATTPDLRGRTLIGAGTGVGLTARTLNTTGGLETHTLTQAEIPSHNHTQNPHNHTQNSHNHTQNPHAHDFAGKFGGSTAAGINVDFGGPGNEYGVGGGYVLQSTATNQVATAVNQTTGGGAAHNNMQPFHVVSYIIKHD